MPETLDHIGSQAPFDGTAAEGAVFGTLAETPISSPPEPEHPSHPKYRPDIDGLRAVAVLSVVVFHAFPDRLPGGFIGVDVFFVISGFLISTIIIENLDKGSFGFVWFYARRIKRIFPALLLVLAACFAFGWFVLFDSEYEQLGKHIAAGAGFVSNLTLWNESGYFDNSAETKPLLHLWSLGVEEQFYIVWPFLLWFAKRRHLNLLAIIAGIAALSFAWNIWEARHNLVADFYSPQTRFWELSCGALLAWVGTHARARSLAAAGAFRGSAETRIRFTDSAALREMLAIAGLCLIGSAIVAINQALRFPGFWALFPVLGAVLIIAAGPTTRTNHALLSNKVSVWFGLISYPLYLWHWPLLSFSRIIEGEVPSVRVRIGAVVLSIALAWLTFVAFERPLRKSRHAQAAVVLLATMMTIFGVVGYATFRAGGLPNRSAIAAVAGAKDLYQRYPHEPFHNENCQAQFPKLMFIDFCLVSQNRPPEVLLFGDSYSNQYYKSFAKALPETSVANLGMPFCFPFTTGRLALSDECEENRRYALKFIEATPSIKTIYVMGHWAALASGAFTFYNDSYRLARTPTPEEARSFIESGKSILGALSRTGKRIVFVGDLPGIDFNIRSCFGSRSFMSSAKTRTDCSTSRLAYDKRNEAAAAAVTDILDAFPKIGTYNPLDVLCDKTTCFAKADGRALYYNSDHLTVFGADRVVKDLLAKDPP